MEWNQAELRSWPKAEIHVHLDTSLNYRTVAKLYPTISESEFNNTFVGPNKCRDLEHFLSLVNPSIEILQTPNALELALKNLVRDQQAESVIYTEIRMAPLLHTLGGLSPEAVADHLCQAAEEIEFETGVVVRLIFCTMRHFTRAQSTETAKLALQYRRDGVCGFDIAGDEAGFSLKHQEDAFQMVKEAGLPITAHVGEAQGAGSVKETLLLLKPDRIGHGVRSVEDPEVVQMLRDTGTHLEICPSSNIQVNVFNQFEDHTIQQLLDEGLQISINTDGRCLTNTSLTKEYHRLQHTFGWTREIFHQINRMTLRAAFCEPELKKKLLDLI